MSTYAITVSVPYAFTETVQRTRAALAEQGFGVLTEIDVAATMKAKLDVDLPPQLILGACNPPLAHRALVAEPSVGVLLPCNVVLRYLDEGHTVVEALDPRVMSDVADATELTEIAAEARERVTAALARLSSPEEAP